MFAFSSDEHRVRYSPNFNLLQYFNSLVRLYGGGVSDGRLPDGTVCNERDYEDTEAYEYRSQPPFEIGQEVHM